MSLPLVAIVGRPNVGKSTLFNRLVGFKKAVVHDRPGVTRDRLYEQADLLSRRVMLIDTGGLEARPDTEMLIAMRAQTLVAVEEADVLVFVVDGRAGWTHADGEVAALLRHTNRPVVLAVNKIDGARHDDLVHDFWSVGIQPMFAISAEHAGGIYDLVEAICERLPPAGPEEVDEEEDPFAEPPEVLLDEDGEPINPALVVVPGPIRIAVIGRPNIGKSTLINHLLGEERHLVMDQPGTTMDPVDSPIRVGDQDYVLVDTAGVRKRARIDDALERFVSLRSIQAIEKCHVSLLMIDATEGITDQDAKLAQLVIQRGRALILLFNKWDLAKNIEDIDSRRIGEAIEQHLPHATWAPYLFISAKTGKGLSRIFPLIQNVYEGFNRRITTSKLNRFLEAALAAYTPPQVHHHPVRIYYMAQTRIRPPTFVVFANTPEGVSAAYQRYLNNQLREAFGFHGAPLKLHIRRRRKLSDADEP